MSEIDIDSILDSTDAADEKVEPDVEPEKVEPEVEPEPVKEPEPEKEPVKEPEKEPEDKPTVSKENEWTLTAVMDERDKRQKWQKRAEEAEAKLAPKAEDDISVFSDEEGYNRQQGEKLESALRNSELNMSEAFAQEVFGDEVVAEATEWMKTEGFKSPHVVAQFHGAKLPFHEAVKMFRAEKDRLNPEAFKAKLKAEILEEIKAETTEKKETVTDITPSLIDATSSGDTTEVVESIEDMQNP